ncbi:hypothetical protein QUF99_01035 [Bacillus sp. DX4.1]|nr:hypothetical protein [Bacillus sp. DX4.1]MDM5186061.1 hypothetical protein [Bacillus sp. DX4.1]
MGKEIYPFKIILRNEDITVGGKIFAPNGREGTITWFWCKNHLIET